MTVKCTAHSKFWLLFLDLKVHTRVSANFSSPTINHVYLTFLTTDFKCMLWSFRFLDVLFPYFQTSTGFSTCFYKRMKIYCLLSAYSTPTRCTELRNKTLSYINPSGLWLLHWQRVQCQNNNCPHTLTRQERIKSDHKTLQEVQCDSVSCYLKGLWWPDLSQWLLKAQHYMVESVPACVRVSCGVRTKWKVVVMSSIWRKTCEVEAIISCDCQF